MLISDNELLGMYVKVNDQAAFEQLIRRHWSMVYSICRSMLWRQEDAEDAFQAIFLLLSTKSPRLMQHNSVGGWLHETSVRICLKLRRKIQRTREIPMSTEPAEIENEPWRAITKTRTAEILHREIARLPLRYREAIVLCHLEGKSRAEAAATLDCTTASVKAALARGRKMLRQRLIRHGIAASTALGVAAVVTSIDVANAGAQESLIQSTIQFCQGCTPDLGVGTEPGIIQSLANNELADMTFGLTQTSLVVAAGLMAISGLSLAALGSQQPSPDNPMATISVLDVNTYVSTAPPIRIQDFGDQLEQLQIELETLKEELGSQHPKVVELTRKIAELGGVVPNPLPSRLPPDETAKTSDETWIEYVNRLAALSLVTQSRIDHWNAGNSIEIKKTVQTTEIDFQTRTRKVNVTRNVSETNENGEVVTVPKHELVDQHYTVAVPKQVEKSARLNIPAPGTKPENATNPGFASSWEKKPDSIDYKLSLPESAFRPDDASKEASESWSEYVKRLHKSKIISDTQLADWKNGKQIKFDRQIPFARSRDETRTREVPITVMMEQESETGETIQVPATSVQTQTYVVQVPYVEIFEHTITIPIRGSRPDSEVFSAMPPMPIQPLAIHNDSKNEISAAKLESSLRIKPRQSDARYDTREPDGLLFTAVRNREGSGWEIKGTDGRLYRQLLDSNNDGKIDNWIFFRNGKETYRDVDLDFDGKVELHQYTVGNQVRYGIDEDQDGTIDFWEYDR